MSSDNDSMIKGVITSQFNAALTMLQGAIRQSNETLWLRDSYQHQS